MNDKSINPAVGLIVGAVFLVIVVALGYKFFLAPQPLPSIKDHPPRPGYTTYPGGGGYPGSTPAPAATTPAAATPAAAPH